MPAGKRRWEGVRRGCKDSPSRRFRDGDSSGLDAIAREGARRLLTVALEAEVAISVEALSDERDEQGHALVVRNGHARTRQVTTVAGAIPVRAPRINDKRVEQTGERSRFHSAILPPYARRSPQVAQVLPLLYLHGLSTPDFVPALADYFGSKAGLSASVVSRLTTCWEAEVKAFMSRSLSKLSYVYVWADGVHFNIRLGDDRRLCCLVMVGVRLDGTKELIAIEDVPSARAREDWLETSSGGTWRSFIHHLTGRGLIFREIQ